jgi:acetolactate synthase-1/2/3 large subunit
MLQDIAKGITGADVLAHSLKQAGAEHAFGIPGGEVLALVDALERADIHFHLARHENAAGFMAEGLWRTTGSVPILIAALGPGVANAVNVIANAQQDRVPLIFITGCVDREIAESFTHQVFDHQAVLRPLVKASFRVERGTEALVIEKALAIASQGRPGPVHIDLPISVAEGHGAVLSDATVRMRPSSAPVKLDEARSLLANAKRPLVLAGLDLAQTRDSKTLDDFLSRTGAPLLTTYKAKGVVAESDPRGIEAVGLSPKADAIVRPLIEAADLIILAGYDPIEMRQGWRHPWSSNKLVIDIVAQDMPHGMHHSSMVLEGDVNIILQRLGEGLACSPTWSDGLPARARNTMRASFAAPTHWGPHAVFETLRAYASNGLITTTDSGAHRILLSQMWSCEAPASLLQSTGLCTMGCALPLANGAALGVKRPVLCIVGDGCLEMSLGELATLRDLNLPVVIAVLVDGSLNLIAMKQNQQGLARASSCNRARNRLHRSAGALAVGRTAESGDPSG